jgi:hypothetical protein
MAPPPPKQGGNRHTKRSTHRQSRHPKKDLAKKTPHPTKKDAVLDDQTRPTTPTPTPPDSRTSTNTMSRMASTTWHAVEFSKTTRASHQPHQGPTRRQPLKLTRPHPHRQPPGSGSSRPVAPPAPHHRTVTRSGTARGSHPGTSHPLRRAGVRSSLPGDEEEITQPVLRASKPCGRDADHRA